MKFFWLHVVFGLAVLPAFCRDVPDSLLEQPLLNGPELRRELAGLQEEVRTRVAWVRTQEKDQMPLVMATCVGEEGYFLLKASEVVQLENYRLHASLEDEGFSMREVRRDTELDLLLVQLIAEEPDSLPPFEAVRWTPATLMSRGNWVCAAAITDPKSAALRPPDLRVGVISAGSRRIPGMGAALGIQMAGPEETAGSGLGEGVLIKSVAAESPAQQAGLRKGDLLQQVAGQAVADSKRVNEVVQKHQPGDLIVVQLLRGIKPLSVRVRLASRSRVLANWEGDDYANGGISIRTDAFPMVLQHDLPLHPQDMGGALFDLQGLALGINIARSDRISTFALPVEVFREKLEDWLEKDRHPPKAIPLR
jgi:serine protease Do